MEPITQPISATILRQAIQKLPHNLDQQFGDGSIVHIPFIEQDSKGNAFGHGSSLIFRKDINRRDWYLVGIIRQLCIIIGISFALNATAQSPYTSNAAMSDMRALVADVRAKAAHEYILTKIDTSKSKRDIHFLLEVADRQIGIDYQMQLEGGNMDFEVAPDTLWLLNSIVGPYLDLFPYWKANFQPDAEIETVSNDQHGRLIMLSETDKRRATFTRQQGSIWMIRVYQTKDR